MTQKGKSIDFLLWLRLINWWSFGWIIEINKDVVESVQGAATYQKGESIEIFMTEVNAYVIIWVKYREKLVRGCVRPRGSHGPKGGSKKNHLPLLMIQCWLFDTIISQHSLIEKYAVQLNLFTIHKNYYKNETTNSLNKLIPFRS